MPRKTLIWIGILVGSTIGSFIPMLWNGSLLSMSSLFLSTHRRFSRSLARIQIWRLKNKKATSLSKRGSREEVNPPRFFQRLVRCHSHALV